MMPHVLFFSNEVIRFFKQRSHFFDRLLLLAASFVLIVHCSIAQCVFPAQFFPSYLEGNTGFKISGINAGDGAGISVSEAGDVNGDGIDDIIIGASFADPNGRSNAGESYVVFGSVNGFPPSLDLYTLNGSNGFIIHGVDSLDTSGHSVSAAGDVNGDGIDDIIIGATNADPNGHSSAGESYIVFGSTSGFPAILNLSSLNGTNGFVLNGVATDDLSGYSVSAAGDVNNDNIDDVIIGATNADSGAGESYVFFGTANSGSPSINLSSLNGSNGFTLKGVDAGDRSGNSVSSAGDINADGIDDVIIGAHFADVLSISNTGESYVIFGSTNAFPSSLNLLPMGVNTGFFIRGMDEYDRLGTSVSSAGDVNGDGIDDIIIGAEWADLNGISTPVGECYVIFGSSNSLWPSVNLSSLNGTNGFVISGVYSYGMLGSSVSGAGDVNGDGIDDIIVGTAVGREYVIFGSTNAFPPSLDLSLLNGSNGFTLIGFGLENSVSGAGDVNGDGVDDMIIGSPNADPNGNNDAGEIYVIFGGPPAPVQHSTHSICQGDSIQIYGNYEHLPGIYTDTQVTANGCESIIVTELVLVEPPVVALGNDITITQGESITLSVPSVSGNSYLWSTGSTDTITTVTPNENMVISLTVTDVFGCSTTDYINAFVLDSCMWVYGQFPAQIDLSNLNGLNGFIINGIDAGDAAGVSVSSAGDVNADGIDDIIIGANAADPNGNSAAGESYIVYGSGNGFSSPLDLSTLNSSNGFVVNGAGGNSNAGGAVSFAGDVNNDGIDDVIIGAEQADPGGNASAGQSYIIFGSSSGFSSPLSLSSLSGSDGSVFHGDDSYSHSGGSVSFAGDMNGDGIDDVVIGARGATPINSTYKAGESYVVYGDGISFPSSLDLSSLNGSNGFAINGVSSFDLSGISVSYAGDVNGDGIDDIIIGASFADPNGHSSAGESYVVFGSTSGFPAFLNLSSLNGTNGFIINGIDLGDQSGEVVSSAGDINADGIDDIIIGARWADPNGNTAAGESYVIFGSSFGFAASLDLSTLNGSNGFVINGANTNDNSGCSVSSAGDINADGIDDIIIGARWADPNGNNAAGESYIIYGSSSGFAASLDLSTLNGSNGFVIKGISSNDNLGISVSAAGDVNHDGIDDIIIGAPKADPNGNSNAGQCYVVFGGHIAPYQHDSAYICQGDSIQIYGNFEQLPGFYTDTLVAANGCDSIVVTELVVVEPPVVALGNDTSIILGESITLSVDYEAGNTYTWSTGSTDTLITITPNQDTVVSLTVTNAYGCSTTDHILIMEEVSCGTISDLFPAYMSLSDLDGNIGFTINGIDSDDQSGYSVGYAGDVNGDGMDDVLIGAHFADPDGSNRAGESYVVFGTNNGFSLSIDLSALNGTNGFVVKGIDANDFSGYSLAYAGDMNGDGIDDIVIGAYRADPNGNNNAGETYVVFGTNAGFMASLDLATLNGSNGFVIEGIDPGDYSGNFVSAAGDVNDDGLDDILIGANRADPNGNFWAGESYIVFGTASTISSPFSLSTLNGINGFTIAGIDSLDRSGLSLSSAGDVNADGISDVIIGARYADPNGNIDAGESYVVFGSTSGFPSILDLSTLNGTNGFIINGQSSGDWLGHSVSGAGDVNADGVDDLIVAAWGGDPVGRPEAGKCYVLFGNNAGFSSPIDVSTLNGSNGFVVNGVAADDHAGQSVSNAGDVNGDGIDDVIIGAHFADPDGNSRAGESYVVFGRSTGFSSSLDLSTLNGNNGFVIQGIDSLDRSGHSVGNAGDVNADGFDDVIIGAYFADANGSVDAGQSYVVFGRPFVPVHYDTSYVCEGDSVLIHGNYENIAGTYSDTLTTANGCDSIAVVELVVITSPSVDLGNDTSIILGDSIVLSVDYEVGNTYTWSTGSMDTIITITPVEDTVVSVFVTNADGCTSSDSMFISVEKTVELAMKVFLSGPKYDTITHLMPDYLRALGLIPTTEPYGTIGLTYLPAGLRFIHVGGGGGETIPSTSSVYNVTGNNAIVDWIFVELRSGSDSTQVTATRSGLLQRDGDVVDVDGSSPLTFNTIPDDYFVAVKHRNHIGVMTGNSVPLSTSVTDTVDFTDAATELYTEHNYPPLTPCDSAVIDTLPDGKLALILGNATGDFFVRTSGPVEINDVQNIYSVLGANLFVSNVYSLADVNLDGAVRKVGPIAGNDVQQIHARILQSFVILCEPIP